MTIRTLSRLTLLFAPFWIVACGGVTTPESHSNGQASSHGMAKGTDPGPHDDDGSWGKQDAHDGSSDPDDTSDPGCKGPDGQDNGGAESDPAEEPGKDPGDDSSGQDSGDKGAESNPDETKGDDGPEKDPGDGDPGKDPGYENPDETPGQDPSEGGPDKDPEKDPGYKDPSEDPGNPGDGWCQTTIVGDGESCLDPTSAKELASGACDASGLTLVELSTAEDCDGGGTLVKASCCKGF